MKKQQFDVTGMTCSACSAHVEKAVSHLDGVESVAVSLLTNSMTVNYDENTTDASCIIGAVEKSGYGASLPAVPVFPAIRGMSRQWESRRCPAEDERGPGGNQEYEIQADFFAGVPCAAVLSVDGPHDGLADSRNFP